jgi:Cytosol aminopeptidase family, N-terminal domain
VTAVSKRKRGSAGSLVPTHVRMLSADFETIDALDVDAIVLGITTDIRPLRGASGLLDWRLCGRISQLLTSGAMHGSVGETLLSRCYNGVGATRLFLFGFGASNNIATEAPARFAHILRVLDKAKVGKIVLDLPPPGNPLLGMVEAHLFVPLGDRLDGIFLPEETYSALHSE